MNDLSSSKVLLSCSCFSKDFLFPHSSMLCSPHLSKARCFLLCSVWANIRYTCLSFPDVPVITYSHAVFPLESKLLKGRDDRPSIDIHSHRVGTQWIVEWISDWLVCWLIMSELTARNKNVNDELLEIQRQEMAWWEESIRKFKMDDYCFSFPYCKISERYKFIVVISLFAGISVITK